MSNTTTYTELETVEAVGERRQELREAGWRADVGWADVGSGSAAMAVTAVGGADVRRTVAYLPALRAVDRGAAKVWQDGDVPVPPEADAREVMLATTGVSDWISEVFEAPPEQVADDRGAADEQPAELPGAA